MRYNRSVPPCTVIPVLYYPDPSVAAEWLQEAFGFTVRLRIANHRIQMRAGAKILTEPKDHMYGERQYNAEDFYGHRWDFTETVADIDPESWGGTSVNL
jgi:uncharacterized glyoxalase superfamily protein PhnB